MGARRLTALGTYTANDPENLTRFDQWLGAPAAFHTAFLGGDTWQDIADPTWVADLWRADDTPILWSVPLLPNEGGTLAEVAAGLHDEAFRSSATILAGSNSAFEDGRTYARIGWEYGMEGFPWSRDPGGDAAFAAAFGHVATVFRSIGDFALGWDTMPDKPVDLVAAYPGDQYVNWIGRDFYFTAKWSDPNPDAAWGEAVAEPHGLTWVNWFADVHGKPLIVPEFGAEELPGAERWTAHAIGYLEATEVTAAAWWDSDDTNATMVSDGGNAAVGAVLRDHWT